MKVLWSAASVRHLQEVVEYIQGESVVGAITIRRRILESVRRIGQLPLSGRVGRVDGTREAVVPRTAYFVVYQVEAQTVEIIGIWHASRMWPESF